MIKIHSGHARIDITHGRAKVRDELARCGDGLALVFGRLLADPQTQSDDKVSIEFGIDPQVVCTLMGNGSTVHDTIAKVINSGGLNISDAAKNLGVSRVTLSRLLSGKTALSEEMAEKLQDVYDLDATMMLVWQVLTRKQSA